MTISKGEPNPATTAMLRHSTPEEIGKVVKGLRTALGWTQETLAELSGLQTRTIQRVEQGQPTSTDTRRAVARAFELNDLDLFNTPTYIPSDAVIQRGTEEFDPEYLLLDARTVNGRQLMILMREMPHPGAVCANSAAELPRAAQDAFADVVDLVHDGMDLLGHISECEILDYGDALDKSIAGLKAAGYCLCVAFRDVNPTYDSWNDKTPLPYSITYLLAAPKDRPPTKVAVARRVSFGI
jgi:transcriptional regulator with XRE-family HTH domain